MPEKNSQDQLTDAFRYGEFKTELLLKERSAFNTHRQVTLSSEPAMKGLPMVFITTPLLNLSEQNISMDAFFNYLSIHDPGLLHMLSFKESGSPFLTLASNRMIEFTTEDMSTQTDEFGKTSYGYQQIVPSFAPTSGSTSITYSDNSNLDILKLHKAWFDYIVAITRGNMRPARETVYNRFLDYTSSIYHFTLDMDGETIQYYDKFTGCFPTVVPYSEFNGKTSNNQELVEYTIEYAYSYTEAMNPSILADFNSVATNPNGVLLKTEEDYKAANNSPSINRSARNENKPDSTILSYVKNLDIYNLTRPAIYLDEKQNKYKLIFT